MRKRIFRTMAILIAISLLLSSVMLCSVFYSHFTEQVRLSIREKAELFHRSTFSESKNTIEDISPGEMRITVVDPQGTVLFDNTADAHTMQNHAGRSEIARAEAGGSAESRRFSQTLSVETWYYAVRMRDGNVLRAAKSSRSVFSLFAEALPAVVFITLLMIFATDFAAGKLTRRIVAPINSANLDGEYAPPYDELAPFARKISEQKEQIRRQIAELNEAANVRREFSANVSHELKTPLTTIAGYAEMLGSGMVAEADRPEVVEKIHAESERMIALVEDIMMLSHLDEGSPGATWEDVDLAACAQETAANLSQKAGKMGVTVSVDRDSAGSLIVNANRSMMQELYYNLIDNAIKYNKPGGKVTVGFRQTAAGLRTDVADTGIGIPSEAQPHVFDRFYRVDKSRSRKTGGTGLGLAIVKHISLVHHAALSLESEEGRGTCITLVFP